MNSTAEVSPGPTGSITAPSAPMEGYSSASSAVRMRCASSRSRQVPELSRPVSVAQPVMRSSAARVSSSLLRKWRYIAVASTPSASPRRLKVILVCGSSRASCSIASTIVR